MSSKFLSCVPLACAFILHDAAEACDASFTAQYQECARIVVSLHPDKSGQARVFAADGSEFTAGQARWMQGQLRNIEEACSRGDSARAAQLLQEVQELLRSHRKAS
jgi:hypothetical protein